MAIKDFRPTVLITAGGTTEAIDNVRCMTNNSTGKTGATIAEWFLANGWQVKYVHGVGAELPSFDNTPYPAMLSTTEVGSAEEACKVIVDEAKESDAIIMAMAVSDFTFDLREDVKLGSGDALAFIDSLKSRIRTNVKILPQLRTANPNAYILGFKYTVDKTADEREKIAVAQNLTANINATFVNDDVEMKEKDERCGLFVQGNMTTGVFTGRKSIGKGIYQMVACHVYDNAYEAITDKARNIVEPK